MTRLRTEGPEGAAGRRVTAQLAATALIAWLSATLPSAALAQSRSPAAPTPSPQVQAEMKKAEAGDPGPLVKLADSGNTEAQYYAGVLFMDFLLSDGQSIFGARDFIPTNIKIKPLPEGMTLKFIDPAKLLDENDKWDKLYKEIVANQSR